MKRINWYSAAVGAILGVFVGMLFMMVIVATTQPHCSAEDSCQPMYKHGKWIIVEVTP